MVSTSSHLLPLGGGGGRSGSGSGSGGGGIRTPGELSPSFAQTGAELDLDDSDIDDLDLHAAVGGPGGPGAEIYEMRRPSDVSWTVGGGRGSMSSRPLWDAEEEEGSGEEGDSEEMQRRQQLTPDGSSSSVESFQLYTPDEEAAVRRKFDRKLVVSDWYQWALTAFYLTYIAFEWMALLWRTVPAHVYVSMLVLSWGVMASLQAVATSYPVLIALRALLGIGEAGFTGIPFYLGYFFKRRELAFRTAIFICGQFLRSVLVLFNDSDGITVIIHQELTGYHTAAPLATSFASTLAWLIVKFAETGPIAPWRLLFLVEGFPSVIVSVVAWSVIPDSPQTARYLTKREKKVARLRLRSEQEQDDQDSAAASGSGSDGVGSSSSSRSMVSMLVDPTIWLPAAMFFLTNMAYSSLPAFLPRILTDMGHTRLGSQALSAPPYLVAAAAVLVTARVSDRLGSRTLPLALHALASAAGYATLCAAEPLRLPVWLRYAAVYPAAVGFFNVVTMLLVWSVNNNHRKSRGARGAASFAVLQAVGQCGPLVGTRLYPVADAPYYTRGMTICAVAMTAVAVLAFVLRFILRRRNAALDAEDHAASPSAVADDEEEGLVAASGRRGTKQGSRFRYIL
ncbi:Major Facilitator Superfamily [Geosmithia morbida]|uniref:Major Facilitator Superfamily n=1 Tax=Geosmithia morbida TaxID=1094350 RepID=A0A9P4YXU3_9HYPO|nr:Major Facilitator Superfamily [Geosmithia morbida]KAF4123787.1 Major Facilitator Superfamily [Geosmithia morbida]